MKRLSLALASVCVALTTAASAQDKYPSRPIHVIVPLSTGSATDVVPRSIFIFEFVQADLGQAIIIENRLGAGGRLGAVTKANPDAYTRLAHLVARTIPTIQQ